MRYEIVLPKCGVSMESGTISRWYKKEGDIVKKDEVIFDVETDKVSVPIESPYQGYVSKILIAEGQEVPVGTIAAMFTDNKEEIIESKLPSSSGTRVEVVDSDDKYKDRHVEISVINSEDFKTESSEIILQDKQDKRVFATPWARKRANDKGIDISKISGTGPNDVVVGRDIDRYSEGLEVNTVKPHDEEAQYIPYKGMRKIIGDRLTESKNQKPHYYLRSEVDIDRILALKDKINADTGLKVSLSEILIYITSRAIERHPLINSALEGDMIRVPSYVNIGLAVGLDDGLLVPVIRNANRKSLIEISKVAKEMVDRAKNRKLMPRDLEGGTFTISNLGMYEVSEFTAIINKDESAILAVGKVDEKLYFDENKQVKAKKILNITLSCDHRIIDGVVGAKFLKQLKDYMEDPVRILY